MRRLFQAELFAHGEARLGPPAYPLSKAMKRMHSGWALLMQLANTLVRIAIFSVPVTFQSLCLVSGVVDRDA